ncbi:hypothetical protein B5648_22945 [Salmonella enterica]|nr:hypothetical protein [Salmonella enterica]
MSEQPEFISSAFKVIEPQHSKLVSCRYDDIIQTLVPSKPFKPSYADHLTLYRQSETYRRQGVELSRARQEPSANYWHPV